MIYVLSVLSKQIMDTYIKFRLFVKQKLETEDVFSI